MSGHTPGPWAVGGPYGLIGIEIQAAGRSIAVVNRVDSNRLDYLNKVRSKAAKRGEVACEAEWEAKEIEESRAAEARATAYLIAAAPDLLSALEGLVESLDSSHPYSMDAARAAIARAKP
jgi:hypothetical protein